VGVSVGDDVGVAIGSGESSVAVGVGRGAGSVDFAVGGTGVSVGDAGVSVGVNEGILVAAGEGVNESLLVAVGEGLLTIRSVVAVGVCVGVGVGRIKGHPYCQNVHPLVTTTTNVTTIPKIKSAFNKGLGGDNEISLGWKMPGSKSRRLDVSLAYMDSTSSTSRPRYVA